MSGDKTTKSVVRMMMAWNDQKEERWLSEQEREGWHLKAVRFFGYTFERRAPTDVAYRLDLLPSCRRDRGEYFGLFKDAGWEHVGCRGLWQVFRKPVVDGQAPEIHTDPQSRIAMYRRLLALSVCMLAVMVSQMGPRIANLDQRHSGSAIARYDVILWLQASIVILFAYGTVRLLLLISRLNRERSKLH